MQSSNNSNSKHFEVQSPMGHLVTCSFNEAKQRYEGHVLDASSGLKYPLTDEILDGIDATLRAEATTGSPASEDDDDWSRSLRDIKHKQALYLRRLVGQAADFLVIKPQ